MNKIFYGLFTVLTVIYLATVFIIRTDSATLAHYHVTDVQLHLLTLTLAIPVIAIWFAAAYGLVNIARYAVKIRKSPEGKGFVFLARGVTLLGLSLPIDSVISNLLSYGVSKGAISRATETIIDTHLSVLFPLVSFILIFIGSRHLMLTVKKAQVNRSHLVWTGIVLLVISVLYIVATLTNPSRMIATPPALAATYYMPDWLIITTIVLPYIIVWACGFYATLFLRSYQRHVGGKIYKKALGKLNIGFFVVILIYILLQFLTAAITSLYGWVLSAVLLLLFVLLIVIAVGFALIASGARGLAKLEEVL